MKKVCKALFLLALLYIFIAAAMLDQDLVSLKGGMIRMGSGLVVFALSGWYAGILEIHPSPDEIKAYFQRKHRRKDIPLPTRIIRVEWPDGTIKIYHRSESNDSV